MNAASRSGHTLNTLTPERRELDLDLPTWYARLAGATPRTAPVTVSLTATASARGAAPRDLPIPARAAA